MTQEEEDWGEPLADLKLRAAWDAYRLDLSDARLIDGDLTVESFRKAMFAGTEFEK